MPAMPTLAESAAPDAATLDAAMREAARAERGATRGDATMLDLWIDSRSSSNLHALERPTLGAGTSRHAWALLADDGGVLDWSRDGAKETAVSAAFGNEEDEIVVVGPSNRPNEVDEGNGGGYGDGSYPGGPPGGGGGGATPSQQTEDAKDTPCVDEVPAGVNKDHLNDLAKAAGTRLAALQDSTGWEWGAFIYKAANGQLFVSEAFTARRHDSLDGAIARVPVGAHIVGYIHTHPVDDTMDERTLSGADRSYIQNIIANGIPDRTVDRNLMSYVTTKDNATSYHTYVYDKSSRSATRPGCDL